MTETIMPYQMNEKRTEIVVLMDASGSMCSIREDAVGGFNAFVDKQKAEDGEANLTVTFFDSNQFTKWQDGIDLKDCPTLNGEYQPRGGTPLLDATGRTIEELEARLAGFGEAERPEKVMVIVITDGEENASRHYTRAQVKQLIEEKQEAASWEFVFLAANVDAFAEGRQMGIPVDRVAGYNSSKKGVRAAFGAMDLAMRSYRSGKVVEGLGRYLEDDE